MFGLAELCILASVVLVTLPVSFVILTGAWRMRHLESYRLCKTAAILAMLPIHAGFILGLPLGVWAFVLLNDPEVKAAFRANELQMQQAKARRRQPSRETAPG